MAKGRITPQVGKRESPLREQLEGFWPVLIHDLDALQFADMYAQTMLREAPWEEHPPINRAAEPPDLVPPQFHHDAVAGSDEKERNVAKGYARRVHTHGRSSSENHGVDSSILSLATSFSPCTVRRSAVPQ